VVRDLSYYIGDRSWEHCTLQPGDLEGQLQSRMSGGEVVFLNFCDGTADDVFAAVRVTQALETVGAAFSGASSHFIDPTRFAMKLAAQQMQVPVPRSCFLDRVGSEGQAVTGLTFPMIVKPPHGYSSVGLTPASLVHTPEALAVQVSTVTRDYGGALVEEFIIGREFTVLTAFDPQYPEAPYTFQPVEFVFPPGESFKHYEMKWVRYGQVQAFPVKDTGLVSRLKEYTWRIFLALQGDGYARCDFRMDASGKIFFLEINPNCGVLYPPDDPGSADLCLRYDPMGQQGFLDLLIRQALHRRRRNNEENTYD